MGRERGPRSLRAPLHRVVLGATGMLTVVVVLVLQVDYLRVDYYATPLRDAVLSATGLTWAVSVVAPAAGAVTACALGARARQDLRRRGARAAHAGRTTAHVLMGTAAALAAVAVTPALVGDRGCVEECGFAALLYALTLGSSALVAGCAGGLLLMLTGSGVRAVPDRPSA